MKKLVIKTVVIVLSIIVGVFAITFGVLCLTTPKTIAKGFENLGSYSASKYFYEKQYEKTESIDDLQILIDNAYGNNDKKSLQVYLGELISHNNFKKFCMAKNEALSPSAMQTEEYYSAFYASVLFDNGNFEGAKKFCSSYVNEMGYTKCNPFTELIKAKLTDLSAEQKAQIKASLNGHKDALSEEVQIGLINEDINKLG